MYILNKKTVIFTFFMIEETLSSSFSFGKYIRKLKDRLDKDSGNSERLDAVNALSFCCSQNAFIT